MGGSNDSGCNSDSSDQRLTVHHEWDSSEQVSTTIIEAVAAVTDTPPTEIDPRLYDILDPDALDRLFQPTKNRSRRRRSGQVTIPIDDCTVTVHADGNIEISQSEELSD